MSVFQGTTGALYWSDAGDGPHRPLLMVHALGADRRLWSAQLPLLSATRRVLTFDLPGHGSSQALPGPYSISDLGTDVIGLAGAAGLDEFDLCGISLGGLLGLWIGVNHHDRVGRLVVCNTAARVGTEESWQTRIDTVERAGMEGILEMALARFFTPGFPAAHPEVAAAAADTLLAIDPVGYLGCCAALRDADLRERVPAIRCPTLVIGSDQDISTPPEDASWLNEHIPGSRLKILEGAAHLSNIEQPEAWANEVTAFLAD